MTIGRVLSKITWMGNHFLRSLRGRQSVLLIDKQGNQLTDRAVTSLRFEGGQDVVLPVYMHIVHEAAPDRGLPDVIRIDCTGLGGHDL